jgi:ankyrin repeat protein
MSTLNLEYYRKQAKDLLKAARAGDAAALARLNGTIALHAAQLTIAREQGFPSWPRFRTFLVQSALDFQGLVAAFVKAAVSDRRLAEELLGAHPDLAAAGLYPALVLGDRDRAARAIAKIGVETKSGPQNWPPLQYCCYSRFAHPSSGRSEAITDTARMLLAAGADPNAFYMPEEFPDNPLSALYGATGLNNNAALGRALLEAGARANDGESLYHSTEHHGDYACVKLLLEYGVPVIAPVLCHMLDAEDPEGVRILLDGGGDPNLTMPHGETALHWAVWRGRSPKIIAMLLDAGASIDARRPDGRTAYGLAAMLGQSENAALLASRGADTTLTPLESFLIHGARPDQIDQTPETTRLLPDLASMHRTAAVRALLAAGIPIDSRGEHGATALHWACWKGYPDIVELLLSQGAPLDVKDASFDADPAGWLDHGRENNGDREGSDYDAVAKLMSGAIRQR